MIRYSTINGKFERIQTVFSATINYFDTFEINDPETGAYIRGYYSNATVFEIYVPEGREDLLKTLLEDATVYCGKRLVFSKSLCTGAIATTWDARQDRNWLLAHVNMWATVPKPNPQNCDLWKYNSTKGWTYLTEKGHRERDENKRCILVYEELINQDIQKWAARQTSKLLTGMQE